MNNNIAKIFLKYGFFFLFPISAIFIGELEVGGFLIRLDNFSVGVNDQRNFLTNISGDGLSCQHTHLRLQKNCGNEPLQWSPNDCFKDKYLLLILRYRLGYTGSAERFPV